MYDRRERDVVRLELIRVELHLVLADEASDGGHLGNAGNSFKLITDEPILKTAQVCQAVLMAVVNQHVFIDPTRPRRIGTEDGVDAGRQLALKLLKVFENAGTRPIKIRAVLEDDVHIRIPKHGLRSDILHLGRSEQRGYNGIGHLVLDDVGGLARPAGMNNDLHVRNIGQGIEGNVPHRPDSGKNQQEDCGENQKAVTCAPIDPAGYHVTSLLQRSR